MPTRTGIVKGVSSADRAAVVATIAANNGVNKSGSDLAEIFAEFPSHADAAAWAVDITGLGYTAGDWDISPLLRAKRTSGFIA